MRSIGGELCGVHRLEDRATQVTLPRGICDNRALARVLRFRWLRRSRRARHCAEILATAFTGIGIVGTPVDAFFQEIENQIVDAQRLGDVISRAGMKLRGFAGETRDILRPMFPGPKEKWADDDALGAALDAFARRRSRSTARRFPCAPARRSRTSRQSAWRKASRSLRACDCSRRDVSRDRR